ncbi:MULTISPECIES: autotransporter domain-containing protein [unclassified Bradyrhizobium]|uniref:autotransporter outer membrane beta-barrel domain-containing protein n=1 Tax=unclassified Bradyrhizobium TaxID=2631580 RepID=UPI001BAB9E9F|nr:MULTISPECIES: autotransporter domain-containing protein [unclassified Bradyrhizobium]MBR1208863.1 autotransporter domain-containing protein [Bradyrhizobium sp. AUGA SZCCT0124]MBR1317161.1 autotransporter domain-containing protein [Bradyrhizobium sp. AUGA SZCCT0051]MBR1345572.1 autotransporter domain-containing protein [Bradyrhizobium sp. AUGA SZCCT0105]MBR1360263.1 autotransporter domain-containing protein [Bradyrhizobium sp. AUGA SZCCT0045]
MNRFGLSTLAALPLVGLASGAQAACSAISPTTNDQVITCTANPDGRPDTTGIEDLDGKTGVTVNINAGAQILDTSAGLLRIQPSSSNWKINNRGTLNEIGSVGSNTTVDNGGKIVAGEGGVAVELLNGGSVSNASGGSIQGGVGVIIGGGAGALTNAGAIAANVGAAVILDSGTVTNSAGGRISGTGAGGVGVVLGSGTLDNNANAKISGTATGALVDAGTINNAGTITSDRVAVQTHGGTLNNLTGGMISGAAAGVVVNLPPQIQSRIRSSVLSQPPVPAVVNAAGATISGAIGVFFAEAGTVTNAGTITATGRAIDFGKAGGADSTVVNYGRIVGDVQMSDGNATLAIATGSTIAGGVSAGGDDGSRKKELQLIGGGADTYDGSFTGFKALTVNAQGGVWTLAGNKIQTYVNGTTINAGSLLVNTTLASQVTVNQGGALGGNGTVIGNVMFNPGSIYRINLNGNQADRLTIGGNAALGGGTLNATIATSGIIVGQNYTVLTANSLSGKFAAETMNVSSAFLSSALVYDAHDVFLRFDRNSLSFAGIGQTSNQAAVGRAFDRIPLTTASPVFNAVLFGSAAEARSAFDRISGEGLAGAQNAAFRASSLFTSSVDDQASAWRAGRDGGGNAIVVDRDGALGYAAEGAYASAGPFTKAPATARFDRTWRVWGSAFGGSSTLQGDAGLGTAAQRDSLFGGNIGLDYQVWPNWLVGVAFGGSEGNFTVDSRTTSGKVDGVHGAIYSTLTLGQLYLSNATTVSSFSNKTTRVIGNIGGLAGETERGNFNSWQLRSRFEVGHDFAIAGARVTPFAAFEIAQLYSDGFAESSQTAGGAPGVLGLAVSRQTTTSAPLFAGVRGERRIELANGMALTPQASMAWVHEFAPTRNLDGTLVSLPGASFIVDGARPASDAAQVSVGAQLDVTRNAALFANFEGEFSSVTQAYAGKGGIRMAW